MHNPIVKFILDEGAKLPEYAHDTDSGADLFSNEDVLYLSPGGTLIIDTGVRMELPPGYEAQVRSKFGLACQSIQVLNSPGTYRGAIKVILHNCGAGVLHIPHGMKIAQLVIAPYVQGQFVVVDELGDTERGDKGFGSTDNEICLGGEEAKQFQGPDGIF